MMNESDEDVQQKRGVRVRMIHVCPPTLVTTDSANFRAVVQHLTGRASSCCCGCKSALQLLEEDRPALPLGTDDVFSDTTSTTPHSSSSTPTSNAAASATATDTKHSSPREEEEEEEEGEASAGAGAGARKKAKVVDSTPLGFDEQSSDEISRMLADICSSSSSSSCDIQEIQFMHGPPSFSHAVSVFDMDSMPSAFPLYLPNS